MGLFSRASAKVRSAGGLIAFFYVQRLRGFAPPAQPDLDPDTCERLSRELKRCQSYLEFGSGGSTLIAHQLKVCTTSVESDLFYAFAVRKALSMRTSVTLLTPDLGLTKRSGWPAFGSSKKGLLYVSAPFPITPFPDLILVDGRYRAACALKSAQQASAAGTSSTLIFDDYKYRSQYHVVEDLLGKPEIVGRSAIFIVGSRSVSDDAVAYFAKDAW